MSKLSWRPLFILILATLALVATSCAPVTESAVENAGNAAQSLDGETVTDRVKMVFTQPNSGSPLLSETRQPARSDDSREFFGTVEAMDGEVWTVSGQRVTIGSSTELRNNIAVGSRVKVHTVTQADGALLVREIELAQGDDSADGGGGTNASRAGEREFFGTVEAMNGNVWTISGQQVTIGSNTEVKNTIAVGNRVKVHALPQADGTLLVREVELAGVDDDDSADDSGGTSVSRAGEREFFGTVEAMNGNTWTISGQLVTVGTGTEIQNNIAVGSQVKVHMIVQADGSLLVREIELASADDDNGDDRDDDSDDGRDDDSDDDQDDSRDDDRSGNDGSENGDDNSNDRDDGWDDSDNRDDDDDDSDDDRDDSDDRDDDD